MNMPLPDSENRYTYADYCTWDDGTRWELIDGIPYAMAAPSTAHQRICGRLYRKLSNYLQGKSCEAFFAPFDVRLNADAEDDTVVQPDLVVICDQSKIDAKGCVGAPDMVIEILSPSTTKDNSHIKFQKYLKASVREYWVVDPESKTATVYVLESGKQSIMCYSDTEVAPVYVLEGFAIELSDVFASLEPSGDAAE